MSAEDFRRQQAARLGGQPAPLPAPSRIDHIAPATAEVREAKAHTAPEVNRAG